MPEQFKHVWIVVGVATLVLFTNLGKPRLWDRDEPRNAGAAVEMLNRGDWCVPVFNDELRTHKPVLLYWLIMSAYCVFGVNEFAARFWSAALASGTTLITYYLGRRLLNPRAGLWSALILATSLMFDLAARAATPDSALVFFSTLSLLIYVWGTFPGSRSANRPLILSGGEAGGGGPSSGDTCFPRSLPVVIAMYGVMGMGILAKGPVALVLPTAVIGMFLLVRTLPDRAGVTSQKRAATWWRRCLECGWTLVRAFEPRHFLRTCWRMRPLTALAASLTVALPWYALVSWRTEGEWLRGFLLEHNWARTASAMEGHSGPVVYYPLALLVGFFPWSIFAVPTWIESAGSIRRRDVGSAGTLLAVCWVGVYVALFSIARTKLPSYVTPCYPALALLTGGFIERWVAQQQTCPSFWPRVSFGVLAVSGIGILLGLPIAARIYLPGEQLLALIGLIPLLGAGLAIGWTLQQRRRLAAVTMTVTAAGLMLALFGLAAVRVDRWRETDQLLAVIHEHCAEPRVGAFRRLEPSWIFYASRPIVEVQGGPLPAKTDTAEVASGGDRRPWTSRPRPHAIEFLAAGSDRFVITPAQDVAALGPLPDGVAVLGEVPRFLHADRLVILGTPRTETARATRRLR